MVIGWFKNRMKRENKIPYRLWLLIRNKNCQLYVSYLVRAEVSQYLKAAWNVKGEQIFVEWQKFLRDFKIIELISPSFNTNLIEISEICRKFYLGRKGIIDLIHLQIARDQDLIFLTNDKRLRQLSIYYKKIKLWHDFYFEAKFSPTVLSTPPSTKGETGITR